MGFFKEFKEFAFKGNVMDMAVGVVVGGAFTAIVTALTGSFINPLVQLITGGKAEDGSYVGGTFEVNGVTFDYGSFISAIINFLIIAFVLFLVIKGINKATSIGKKPEAPAEPTTKTCPFCQSEISIKAVKCPHCTSDQPAEEEA